MAIEVFNRHEKKYLIDEKILTSLQSRIAGYMEPDAYNRSGRTYTIANIYYDTDDSHLIHASLQGPRYKEKLRLRSYGVPRADDKVYLEIKKKFSGLVNKRRSALRLSQAYEFIRTGVLPEPDAAQNRQVLQEIAYLLQEYPLKPKLYLAYDRLAYFDQNDRSLRISFDTGIRTRRTDLALEAGDYGTPLLKKGLWLMEIKIFQSMPIWLARLLSEYQVYPTSFSKYGAEYQHLLLEDAEAGGAILIPEKKVRAAGSLTPAVYESTARSMQHV
ncbi:MAG: polyphosphate polymerase domain-containing protein [Clostridiaceae bacterium]|nr:polyphosphate polymerase domain-containing protein [Clostridiaceae bacterium]